MTKNVAASVRQRLLDRAKADQRPYNELLQHYALERWLYRLSVSPYADRFILKGALMLLAWKVPMARPTRDIDLLARVSNDAATIRSMIAEICAARVDEDGLQFDPTTIATEAIAEDAQYEGVRVT
ncbi:MAG: nucleotidyl transferase AbiEii/AbiGii toxin family protein, partial [Planctomycetota bacterium]